MSRISRLALVAAVVAACDDGLSPLAHGTATVQGSVETTREPAPSGETTTASPPTAAPGPRPESVAVVQVESNGGLSVLATASVAADGSFEVRDVPVGRSGLAVVAYAGGQAVGSVLLHETTRGGSSIIAAPIDDETTVEAEAYSRVRASGGDGASELALLVHLRESSAAMVAASEAEIDAVASGYVAASQATTGVYSTAGTALGASAREQALAEAAIQFAADRHAGMSMDAAHEAFTASALEAYTSAGAGLEQSVMASAAAASTFDATLFGRSGARIDLVSQAVRMNLLARERLATKLSTSTEASLASAIRIVLDRARLALALDGVLDLRALLQTTADDAASAAVEAVVQMTAGGASSDVQAEVRARAEAAVEAARLEARLEGAASAQAAASAVVGYRAAVRTAVDSMLAATGATSARADVVTALLIAACGSAYIR